MMSEVLGLTTDRERERLADLYDDIDPRRNDLAEAGGV